MDDGPRGFNPVREDHFIVLNETKAQRAIL